jgi:hypothetical protein
MTVSGSARIRPDRRETRMPARRRSPADGRGRECRRHRAGGARCCRPIRGRQRHQRPRSAPCSGITSSSQVITATARNFEPFGQVHRADLDAAHSNFRPLFRSAASLRRYSRRAILRPLRPLDRDRRVSVMGSMPLKAEIVPRRLSPLAVASPMHPVAEIKNLRSGMLPCRATFL